MTDEKDDKANTQPEGEEDMVMAEKELKDMQKELRKKKILALTKKACDRNDEALRRLSKN